MTVSPTLVVEVRGDIRFIPIPFQSVGGILPIERRGSGAHYSVLPVESTTEVTPSHETPRPQLRFWGRRNLFRRPRPVVGSRLGLKRGRVNPPRGPLRHHYPKSLVLSRRGVGNEEVAGLDGVPSLPLEWSKKSDTGSNEQSNTRLSLRLEDTPSPLTPLPVSDSFREGRGPPSRSLRPPPRTSPPPRTGLTPRPGFIRTSSQPGLCPYQPYCPG